MTENKQKDTSNNLGAGIAGAAGFALGAATIGAAVALSNKENRKKAGKAIQEMRTKAMEIKKPAEDKIEEVKDTAKKVTKKSKN